MPKQRKQIIIISDQKHLCEKDRKVINFPFTILSKKVETLSIKETQSPFKIKDAHDDRNLAAVGKDDQNPNCSEMNKSS